MEKDLFEGLGEVKVEFMGNGYAVTPVNSAPSDCSSCSSCGEQGQNSPSIIEGFYEWFSTIRKSDEKSSHLLPKLKVLFKKVCYNKEEKIVIITNTFFQEATYEN